MLLHNNGAAEDVGGCGREAEKQAENDGMHLRRMISVPPVRVLNWTAAQSLKCEAAPFQSQPLKRCAPLRPTEVRIFSYQTVEEKRAPVRQCKIFHLDSPWLLAHNVATFFRSPGSLAVHGSPRRRPPGKGISFIVCLRISYVCGPRRFVVLVGLWFKIQEGNLCA